MPIKTRTMALSAVLLGCGVASVPLPASAYPIDCAILLCLAGGWPASAECAAAKAVFIRRITPFPIEAPLQPWNCPMGVAYRLEGAPSRTPLDIVLQKLTPVPAPKSSLTFTLRAAQPAVYIEDGGAAIVPAQAQPRGDISDPEFDFVRAIKVYHIEYEQYPTHDDCRRTDTSRMGTYDGQGRFSWADHPARGSTLTVLNAELGTSEYRYHWDLPDVAALTALDPEGCASVRNRSVLVTWTDYFGTPGFHEVHY